MFVDFFLQDANELMAPLHWLNQSDAPIACEYSPFSKSALLQFVERGDDSRPLHVRSLSEIRLTHTRFVRHHNQDQKFRRRDLIVAKRLVKAATI